MNVTSNGKGGWITDRTLLAGTAMLLTASIAAKSAEVPVPPPPGASSRIDQIKQRGSLRVSVLAEYPWLKQNSDGADRPFKGPAWRLAEEYASRLGVKLETVPVRFENKVSIC